MPKLNDIVTKTAFAKIAGLTKGRISQLIEMGMPIRNDGKVDVNLGLAWIENNLDEARRNKGGTTPMTSRGSTMAEARRLHEIFKVQRAKLAFEKEQGKLIDVADAERTVFARAKAERDAHIAWVQRSAPLMAAELGVETGTVFTVLDRLMREHLEHLAETPLGGLLNANSE